MKTQPDAGLKPGSSTEHPTPVSATTAGGAVEERPFRAASAREKKKNPTLPKAVAAERSSPATGATTNADISAT
jgi:hypothetical protein